MKSLTRFAQDYKRDIYPDWQQDISEISAVAHILHGLDVQSMLEIGTAEGGSANMWLEALSLSYFVSVDIDEDKTREMRDRVLDRMWDAGVTVRAIAGYSQNSDVVEKVKAAIEHTGIDCVFIDGGHSYMEAKLDWENYGPLASVCVVFHDIGLPDVRKLWNEITLPKLAIVESGRYGMGIVFK